MPVIQVQVLEGRSDEKIKELISGITETTVKTLEVKPEQVRVIVQTVPHKYWGVGGVTKDEIESERY
ncbi:tautomerase family protein [Mesobacillus subterraneus]|uniref:tautomerase family protein n=1 Tax=Mesobacillus subterraneus TaxID=285983 RepID=UPI0020417C3D|nr:tautomerase family protein [Mesobacillus subterraneus]MCM3666293.1 tautomerase family protein [Mesobacillus subterraneus]MCM3685291.1 tautomerase family protein [Mesobacillus subterraneus]